MCESKAVDRVIIPPAKAQEIVAGIGNVYLRECVCRAREQACPPDRWEVCLLFEHAAKEDLQDARPITTDRALSILRAAAEQGLINQIFYTRTGHHLTEICNCCTCCCAPVRHIQQEGNYHEQLRTGYVAVTDGALCVGCGLCLDRCAFEARRLDGGELRLLAERCFGCGRCVDSCPEGAIRVELQAGQGIALPGFEQEGMSPLKL